MLDVLEEQLRRFEIGGEADYEIVTASLEYFQGFPGRCHHPKEDLVLDRLRKRDPFVMQEVGDLARAHCDIEAALRAFGGAVTAVLSDAEVPRQAFLRIAKEFLAQQRKHCTMEETLFFPAIARILADEDWQVLQSAVTQERDPLLDGSGDRRFELLRRTILEWQSETVCETRLDFVSPKDVPVRVRQGAPL